MAEAHVEQVEVFRLAKEALDAVAPVRRTQKDDGKDQDTPLVTGTVSPFEIIRAILCHPDIDQGLVRGIHWMPIGNNLHAYIIVFHDDGERNCVSRIAYSQTMQESEDESDAESDDESWESEEESSEMILDYDASHCVTTFEDDFLEPVKGPGSVKKLAFQGKCLDVAGVGIVKWTFFDPSTHEPSDAFLPTFFVPDSPVARALSVKQLQQHYPLLGREILQTCENMAAANESHNI